MEYSNDMDDIYENIEEHNPVKKSKLLTVFDGMILIYLVTKRISQYLLKYLLDVEK